MIQYLSSLLGLVQTEIKHCKHVSHELGNQPDLMMTVVITVMMKMVILVTLVVRRW